MSADCASYMDAQQVLVSAFRCPRREEGDEASAVYCCGFQDVKYCCDDPNSFFPYQHSYMWWLRSLKPSHNLSLQEQVGIVHQSVLEHLLACQSQQWSCWLLSSLCVFSVTCLSAQSRAENWRQA
ncbi:protein shisa-like-2A isoform X5 [Sceloporus undulatus]|uniref:protein shisa-like-2A isoform X5 n=1 Tax=Sceloporus undulatus TaxID=8520 RepID=UPI001C4B9ADE|nr:protein shisa-like-2A isoform X5 [Sceloporus undulatus]